MSISLPIIPAIPARNSIVSVPMPISDPETISVPISLQLKSKPKSPPKMESYPWISIPEDPEIDAIREKYKLKDSYDLIPLLVYLGEISELRRILDIGYPIYQPAKLQRDQTWMRSKLKETHGVLTPKMQRRIRSSALQEAVRRNCLPIVQELIDRGMPIDVEDAIGQTSVMVAASSGRTDCLKFLLENGGNCNSSDFDGSIPLHLAVYFDHIASVKMLLEHGSEIGIRNFAGRTPFQMLFSRHQSHAIYDNLKVLPFGSVVDWDQFAIVSGSKIMFQWRWDRIVPFAGEEIELQLISILAKAGAEVDATVGLKYCHPHRLRLMSTLIQFGGKLEGESFLNTAIEKIVPTDGNGIDETKLFRSLGYKIYVYLRALGCTENKYIDFETRDVNDDYLWTQFDFWGEDGNELIHQSMVEFLLRPIPVPIIQEIRSAVYFSSSLTSILLNWVSS